MAKNEYKLTHEIISRSSSKNWDEAKKEWKLEGICLSDEPETCLCGHYPISELCCLGNNLTGQSVTIGNCCVKKFIQLDEADCIFQALKRIKKDNTKSVNIETLGYAIGNHIISEKDENFYHDILHKRILSEKQLSWKKSINQKIINKLIQKTDKKR